MKHQGQTGSEMTTIEIVGMMDGVADMKGECGSFAMMAYEGI